MSLTVGVLKETRKGERRVAMVPRTAEMLRKLGLGIRMESGAGTEAGFPDAEFAAKGVEILSSAAEVCRGSEILLQVQVDDVQHLNAQHIVVGFCDPLSDPELSMRVASHGAMLFSMELVPRITRAQSMDALSSMASIAGYKAVLLAAAALPRLFPMMMTAAGTIPPAKVLILGAGVAGLQAIATARRLGSVVSAYDVRSAVKEQIESLGAKFVNITIGTSGEGSGGYARALDEETLRKQREQMGQVIKAQDVVITTAAVPGKKAPILVTADMTRQMAPGSVIVDLAAERGGNCELTRAGETVFDHGVQILGPVNLPSTVPYHASQMYARNLVEFLKTIVTKTGDLQIDVNDEIVRETLVTRGGEVVHPRVQALLKTVNA